MLHHAPGLYLNTFGHRGGGGYVPLSGSEPDIVLAANFNGNADDETGNHTFSGVLFQANGSVDGQRSVAQLPGSSAGRVITNSGTAHAIPTGVVSYGGMFYLETATSAADLVAVIHSASSVSANNTQSYGLRFRRSATVFQRVPFSANTTRGEIWDQWFHLVIAENAARTSAKMYINGILVDTFSITAGDTAGGAGSFSCGEVLTGVNYEAGGFCSDVFVTARELNDAEALTYATNAFGETPPAVPA